VDNWPEVLEYGASHDELQRLLRGYFNIYTDWQRYGDGAGRGGRGNHYVTSKAKISAFEVGEQEVSASVATAKIKNI
jgi:hypothetical protein